MPEPETLAKAIILIICFCISFSRASISLLSAESSGISPKIVVASIGVPIFVRIIASLGDIPALTGSLSPLVSIDTTASVSIESSISSLSFEAVFFTRSSLILTALSTWDSSIISACEDFISLTGFKLSQPIPK